MRELGLLRRAVLATRDGRICTRPRADGRGLDIPTRRVDGLPVEECLRGLLRDTFGGVRPTTLLGYVRNTVAAPTEGCEWPTSEAYFAVWHCELPPDDDVTAVWLTGAEAKAEPGGPALGRSPRSSIPVRTGRGPPFDRTGYRRPHRPTGGDPCRTNRSVTSRSAASGTV
ncbi:hypothetical protein [Micromonospora cremea]|uniref:Nudix hydrolase domain-containing protein n=1 Tax=Micromonospora cremea TaxID=709881 RepID=A0A1N6BDW5_9ACTN|nr:hypothetical protein [Micromonospora cremea]SIN44385.1 hypothetical protein SAMN04489832_7239 [Micromonospora cremea]